MPCKDRNEQDPMSGSAVPEWGTGPISIAVVSVNGEV